MSSKAINLRCTSKTGRHVLSGLSLNSNIGELMDKIAEVTKIPKDWIKIRQGYPPQMVDLSDETLDLNSLRFRSGDTIIVEEDQTLACENRQKKIDTVLQNQSRQARGMLMRKVVPADNSCLFTSINSLMNNGVVDTSSSGGMRELIAGVVLSDPENFSEAFLGKTNDKYCKWIMNKESWGGAIEISILSKYYSIEIDVVDTQSGRIDRFGEDQNYAQRILVIYDGIHYDPLMLEPFDTSEPHQVVFSTGDANILCQAMEIANEAKSSRQFTNVNSFTLKCLICQTHLKGQTDAQNHASQTGHINFGEV